MYPQPTPGEGQDDSRVTTPAINPKPQPSLPPVKSTVKVAQSKVTGQQPPTSVSPSIQPTNLQSLVDAAAANGSPPKQARPATNILPAPEPLLPAIVSRSGGKLFLQVQRQSSPINTIEQSIARVIDSLFTTDMFDYTDQGLVTWFRKSFYNSQDTAAMPFFATPALASLMLKENKALAGHVSDLQKNLSSYDSMQLHSALVSVTEVIFRHYSPSVPTMVKLAIHFLTQGSTISEDSFNGLDSNATIIGQLSDTIEEYYQTDDEDVDDLMTAVANKTAREAPHSLDGQYYDQPGYIRLSATRDTFTSESTAAEYDVLWSTLWEIVKAELCANVTYVPDVDLAYRRRIVNGSKNHPLRQQYSAKGLETDRQWLNRYHRADAAGLRFQQQAGFDCHLELDDIGHISVAMDCIHPVLLPLLQLHMMHQQVDSVKVPRVTPELNLHQPTRRLPNCTFEVWIDLFSKAYTSYDCSIDKTPQQLTVSTPIVSNLTKQKQPPKETQADPNAQAKPRSCRWCKSTKHFTGECPSKDRLEAGPCIAHQKGKCRYSAKHCKYKHLPKNSPILAVQTQITESKSQPKNLSQELSPSRSLVAQTAPNPATSHVQTSQPVDDFTKPHDRVCSILECKKAFHIPLEGDQGVLWHQQRGLYLPKRCSDCIKAGRRTGGQWARARSQQSTGMLCDSATADDPEGIWTLVCDQCDIELFPCLPAATVFDNDSAAGQYGQANHDTPEQDLDSNSEATSEPCESMVQRLAQPVMLSGHTMLGIDAVIHWLIGDARHMALSRAQWMDWFDTAGIETWLAEEVVRYYINQVLTRAVRISAKVRRLVTNNLMGSSIQAMQSMTGCVSYWYPLPTDAVRHWPCKGGLLDTSVQDSSNAQGKPETLMSESTAEATNVTSTTSLDHRSLGVHVQMSEVHVALLSQWSSLNIYPEAFDTAKSVIYDFMNSGYHSGATTFQWDGEPMNSLHDVSLQLYMLLCTSDESTGLSRNNAEFAHGFCEAIALLTNQAVEYSTATSDSSNSEADDGCGSNCEQSASESHEAWHYRIAKKHDPSNAPPTPLAPRLGARPECWTPSPTGFRCEYLTSGEYKAAVDDSDLSDVSIVTTSDSSTECDESPASSRYDNRSPEAGRLPVKNLADAMRNCTLKPAYQHNSFVFAGSDGVPTCSIQGCNASAFYDTNSQSYAAWCSLTHRQQRDADMIQQGYPVCAIDECNRPVHCSLDGTLAACCSKTCNTLWSSLDIPPPYHQVQQHEAAGHSVVVAVAVLHHGYLMGGTEYGNLLIPSTRVLSCESMHDAASRLATEGLFVKQIDPILITTLKCTEGDLQGCLPTTNSSEASELDIGIFCINLDPSTHSEDYIARVKGKWCKQSISWMPTWTVHDSDSLIKHALINRVMSSSANITTTDMTDAMITSTSTWLNESEPQPIDQVSMSDEQSQTLFCAVENTEGYTYWPHLITNESCVSCQMPPFKDELNSLPPEAVHSLIDSLEQCAHHQATMVGGPDNSRPLVDFRHLDAAQTQPQWNVDSKVLPPSASCIYCNNLGQPYAVHDHSTCTCQGGSSTDTWSEWSEEMATPELCCSSCDDSECEICTGNDIFPSEAAASDAFMYTSHDVQHPAFAPIFYDDLGVQEFYVQIPIATDPSEVSFTPAPDIPNDENDGSLDWSDFMESEDEDLYSDSDYSSPDEDDEQTLLWEDFYDQPDIDALSGNELWSDRSGCSTMAVSIFIEWLYHDAVDYLCNNPWIVYRLQRTPRPDTQPSNRCEVIPISDIEDHVAPSHTWRYAVALKYRILRRMTSCSALTAALVHKAKHSSGNIWSIWYSGMTCTPTTKKVADAVDLTDLSMHTVYTQTQRAVRYWMCKWLQSMRMLIQITRSRASGQTSSGDIAGLTLLSSVSEYDSDDLFEMQVEQAERWSELSLAMIDMVEAKDNSHTYKPQPYCTLVTLSDSNQEFLAHCIFIEECRQPLKVNQICAIWDSASNTCLIKPHLVCEHWEWITKSARDVTGVGGKRTPVIGVVVVPLQLIHSGRRIDVCATVVDFHPVIDFMFGLDYFMAHKAVYDAANYRVYNGDTKEVIRLDYLSKVKARLCSHPIHMLSICGGCDPQLGMAMNMGFRVKQCWSFERYQWIRDVSAALNPSIIHLEPHDFMKADCNAIVTMLSDADVRYLAFVSGFPCTPWSRLSNDPLGFNHPLAALVVKGADLLNLLRKSGMLWTILNETVVPHENLTGDLLQLESMMNVPYLMHNCLDSGGAASRPRLLGLHGATVGDMPHSTHLRPSFVLDDNWEFENIPVECLVAAGDETRSPVWLKKRGRQNKRHPSPDERDRINPGGPAGLSHGFGKCEVPDKMRQRISGNAFSNDMLWGVMYQWAAPCAGSPGTALITSAQSLASMTPLEAQRVLSLLPNHEMFALFSGMVAPDFMPKVPIFVKPGHGVIPFQTRAPGTVPAKLQISADYKVACMLREGTHRVIPYHKDLWIMLLFFKSKCRSVTAEFDGPNWKKGDELTALRPLVDFRPSNAAQFYPPWLIEWSPDNAWNIMMFPPGVTHLADHDSSDAYHAMQCADDAKAMGCSKYRNSQQNEVILEPQCCQQGQASSAAYFPMWVKYGYNTFIGQHHRFWWLDFSDDSMAFGAGEEECELRYNILGCIKVIMGLKPQLKRSPSTTTEKHWAGLVWSVRGICISDTARDAIVEACGITPKGTTQMRRLRGMIQSGILGFDMSPTQLSDFVKLMAPINEAITASEKESKYIWPQSARDAQEAVALKMSNTPKAYTHPDRVLDDSHSLLALGDGDPAAVCSGLISVPVADANDITLDMIHDMTSGCVLVCMYFQTLNKHQARWGMYEIETFAHVVCHRKSHKFINECMSRFISLPPSQMISKGDAQRPAKLKYASDNTTALGMIPTFTIPEGKIEYLTAKFQRFCGWCEEFVVTTFWPVCFMSVLGDCNSMFDTLVRMTAALKARIPGIEQDPDDSDALPITLICQPATPADVLSLTCECDQPACNCSTESVDCIHPYAMVCSPNATLLNNHNDGAPSEDDLDQASAPAETAGDCGHSEKTLPVDVSIHYLGLNQAKWQTLIMMYERDSKSKYADIFVRDIYRVLLGSVHGIPNSVVSTVRSWRNKMFYLINVGVPGMPALFTPSSQARAHDGDNTKLLVPVIPDMAPIRISTRSMTVAPFDYDAPEWDRNFLREDLLWIAHYRPTPHASKSATVENVMRQAWWPSIEEWARRVVKYCSVCSQHESVERSVGVGIKSCQRFTWLVIDDKILPQSIADATSYVAVLGMVDPASGATMYRLRRGMGAIEAAAIVFCAWVCTYGVPQYISSDNHGAFTAEVARFICEILGVENRVYSAVYHSRSQAHIENRNKVISDTLRTAEAKGDVTCDLDLELYIAEAVIKLNHLTVTDGSTAFERCTGEPPRTVNSSLSAPHMDADEIEECLSRMNALDSSVARLVYQRCNSLMRHKAIQTDKRARYNRAHLLSKEAAQKSKKFNFTEGTLVSYGGRRVTLDRLEPAGSPDPITCWVTDKTGKTLHVRVDSLRPLAVNIDEKLMPKSDDAWKRAGAFIVFDTEFGLSSGTIVEIQDSACSVHEWMPVVSKTSVLWAPLWTKPGTTESPARYVKQPDGWLPSLIRVDYNDVYCSAELKARKFTAETVARLENMGIDL